MSGYQLCETYYLFYKNNFGRARQYNLTFLCHHLQYNAFSLSPYPQQTHAETDRQTNTSHTFLASAIHLGE